MQAKYFAQQGGTRRFDRQSQNLDQAFLAQYLVMGRYRKGCLQMKQNEQTLHLNYKHLANEISNNLSTNQISFLESCDTFKFINRWAINNDMNKYQLEAILQGFSQHWNNCIFTEPFQEIKILLFFIPLVSLQIHRKFVAFCSNLIQNHFFSPTQESYFKQGALTMVREMLQSSIHHERILPLVYEFDLYLLFQPHLIAQLVITSSKPHQVIYIFQSDNKDINEKLTTVFLQKCAKSNNIALYEPLIKKLQTKFQDISKLNYGIENRYMLTLLTRHPLFFIELVVRKDAVLLQKFIYRMKLAGHIRCANYLTLKYEQKQNEDRSACIREKEKDIIKKKLRFQSTINVLLAEDRFGPTQIEVLLQKQANQFIYLRDYDLYQEDVTFVNISNIDNIKTDDFSNSIGFDSQSMEAAHLFEQSRRQIIQIYSHSHIYIFDYSNLKKDNRFKHIMGYLLARCKIYCHDLEHELTEIIMEFVLDITEEDLYFLVKNRVVDTSKLYKKLNPKDDVSNIEHVCQILMKKSISRYEHFSAWKERPLRKAQFHHAALDCVLPLKLGNLMEKQLTTKQSR